MLNFIIRFYKNEDGQGLTEYALILGSIAILVLFILLTGIFGHTERIFGDAEVELDSILND